MNQQATYRHLDIFGTPGCGTATRPDRYERQHCSVSLMIMSSGFYPNYTRFELVTLLLSWYGPTL